MDSREPCARGLPALHALQLARPHKALKGRYPRTLAMAVGIADHVWSLEEITALLDRSLPRLSRAGGLRELCRERPSRPGRSRLRSWPPPLNPSLRPEPNKTWWVDQ